MPAKRPLMPACELARTSQSAEASLGGQQPAGHLAAQAGGGDWGGEGGGGREARKTRVGGEIEGGGARAPWERYPRGEGGPAAGGGEGIVGCVCGRGCRGGMGGGGRKVGASG